MATPRLNKVIAGLEAGQHVFASFVPPEPAAAIEFGTAAYDALVGGRSYRASVAHEEAVRAIVEGSGTHFDPEVVEAFLTVHQQFRSLMTH